MPLPLLDLDRWFPDFNFCAHTHPDLRPGHGPSRTLLAEWVYQARQGDRRARLQFADTMYRTLDEESFRCFERTHGARPIRHSDWFYCKLIQFLELLAYEQLSVTCSSGQGPETPTMDRPWEEGFLVLGAAEVGLQEEDVQAAFSAEENDPAVWGQIVDEVSSAPADRIAVLEAILARRRGRKGTRKQWEWGLTRRRNNLIRELQQQGRDGLTICEELDNHSSPLLPALRSAGINSWVAGWTDARLNRNIQQLLSKQKHRKEPVKS